MRVSKEASDAMQHVPVSTALGGVLGSEITHTVSTAMCERIGRQAR